MENYLVKFEQAVDLADSGNFHFIPLFRIGRSMDCRACFRWLGDAYGLGFFVSLYKGLPNDEAALKSPFERK